MVSLSPGTAEGEPGHGGQHPAGHLHDFLRGAAAPLQHHLLGLARLRSPGLETVGSAHPAAETPGEPRRPTGVQQPGFTRGPAASTSLFVLFVVCFFCFGENDGF